MVRICTFPGGCDNMCEGSTDFCGTHNHMMRKAEKKKQQQKQVYQIARSTKPIPKVSKKRAKENPKYNKEAREFVRGKSCAVFPHLAATQVHHKKGRQGYADEWARSMGITLLHDKRWWLAVSDDGHTEINNNTAWALKMGFSELRTKKN